MNDMTIPGTSPFDSIRRTDEAGEHWTGRDLMPLMDYAQWVKFAIVIEKARQALAVVQGESVAAHHFPKRESDGGRWGNQSVEDYRLTRFGAYLVAMAGDDTKQAVAAARVYFAVKTREAEVRDDVDLSDPLAALERTNQNLGKALEIARAERQRADIAERQVAELEPSAAAWDTLADTGADYSAREAAYILNRDPAISTGQNLLLDLLRQWRVIGLDGRPYANHAAHVTLRPRTRLDQSTGERVAARPQVRVTVAGLRYLHKRLGGSAPLDLSQAPGAVAS